MSGPKGKTLPLVANASWLSFVEPTLSDKPGREVIQTETDAIADENAAGATAFVRNGLNGCGLGFHRPITIDER